MKAIATLSTIGILLLGVTGCNVSPLSDSTPIVESEQADAQAQVTVKIAGSSATITALEILAEAYQAKHENVKIEFLSTTQSEGAMAAVQNQLIDLAGVTNVPTLDPETSLVHYQELAGDLLVVATHSSVTGVTNLTTDQLRAIYRGDITNWQAVGGPDATIVVLDRPEDESAKKLLRQHYLGQDPTTANAILLSHESELIQTLQDIPYTIGAFSLATSLVRQLPVNRLSLNGVAPNLESFNQGQYRMMRRMGIVWSKTPSVATQDFIDFIFSPAGDQVIQENGFVPAS